MDVVLVRYCIIQNPVAKMSAKALSLGEGERDMPRFKLSTEFIIHKAGGSFLRTKTLFLKLAPNR